MWYKKSEVHLLKMVFYPFTSIICNEALNARVEYVLPHYHFLH